MQPWFIATQRFDSSDVGWQKYLAWSRLEQLNEVISLDPSLCPSVLPEIKREYWDHIVNEDFLLNFFVDLDYLRGETAGVQNKNLLCVFRNPSSHPNSNIPNDFEFVGYDLIDKKATNSALTNCGGFPKAFSNGELSAKGLLTTYQRSREVQELLRREYPHEHHADCDLWPIFRQQQIAFPVEGSQS